MTLWGGLKQLSGWDYRGQPFRSTCYLRRDEIPGTFGPGVQHPSSQRRGVGFLRTQKLAEGVGFEPTIPCGIPVFKTGAFVRSAIPPCGRLAATYPADMPERYLVSCWDSQCLGLPIILAVTSSIVHRARRFSPGGFCSNGGRCNWDSPGEQPGLEPQNGGVVG